jgi:hypothetical protein
MANEILTMCNSTGDAGEVEENNTTTSYLQCDLTGAVPIIGPTDEHECSTVASLLTKAINEFNGDNAAAPSIECVFGSLLYVTKSCSKVVAGSGGINALLLEYSRGGFSQCTVPVFVPLFFLQTLDSAMR